MSTLFAAVATALLLTAAEAQTYYSTPLGTAQIATDCATPQQPDTQFRNANGLNILRFPAGVTCPKATEAGSQYTLLDPADASPCFSGTTAVKGAQKTVCPAAYGTMCSAETKFCQTDDKVGSECTEEWDGAKYCFFPAATKAIQSRAVFPSSRYDYPAPEAIGQTLVASLAKNCPVYGSGSKVYTYTTDGGNGVLLGMPRVVDAPCDADAVAAAIQAVVDDLNKDPADQKYPVKGSYVEVDLQTACFNRATGKFFCAADKVDGCTYPCSDGTVCNSDSDCGIKCKKVNPEDTTKQCVSSAISAVVLPALAAAVSLALFF